MTFFTSVFNLHLNYTLPDILRIEKPSYDGSSYPLTTANGVKSPSGSFSVNLHPGEIDPSPTQLD
jgi:hypothetical protein